MVLFLYEHKHIGRFSNLHQCTFKTVVLCLKLKAEQEQDIRKFKKEKNE